MNNSYDGDSCRFAKMKNEKLSSCNLHVIRNVSAHQENSICTVPLIRTCVMIMARLHIQGVSHNMEIMLSNITRRLFLKGKLHSLRCDSYVILAAKALARLCVLCSLSNMRSVPKSRELVQIFRSLVTAIIRNISEHQIAKASQHSSAICSEPLLCKQ